MKKSADYRVSRTPYGRDLQHVGFLTSVFLLSAPRRYPRLAHGSCYGIQRAAVAPPERPAAGRRAVWKASQDGGAPSGSALGRRPRGDGRASQHASVPPATPAAWGALSSQYVKLPTPLDGRQYVPCRWSRGCAEPWPPHQPCAVRDDEELVRLKRRLILHNAFRGDANAIHPSALSPPTTTAPSSTPTIRSTSGPNTNTGPMPGTKNKAEPNSRPPKPPVCPRRSCGHRPRLNWARTAGEPAGQMNLAQFSARFKTRAVRVAR